MRIIITRFIDLEPNTLYWKSSDIKKDTNYSMKELWDYAYHLNFKEFGFIRLLLLNSGLNIKNKETFYLLNSIISYILKINLLYQNANNIINFEYNFYKNIDKLYNEDTICYGITDIEIYNKENDKFISIIKKGNIKMNIPKY